MSSQLIPSFKAKEQLTSFKLLFENYFELILFFPHLDKVLLLNQENKMGNIV